jgi:hypothetical protein
MLPRARSRRLAAAAGVVVAAVSLAACDKPVQSITAQAGSTALTIKPSTYCADGTHCRDFKVEVPVLTVAPDAKVLIDVPKKLVDRGWAINVVDPSTNKSIVSGAVGDSHSYRLSASINNNAQFVVQVLQLNGTKPDGSLWSFAVRPSGAKT